MPYFIRHNYRFIGRLILLLLLLAIYQFSTAQQVVKGYFMFPINPGQKNFLSANMGELRPNHFHAGIDVKTGFSTGLPVYAAQDGYISRVRISSYGYGNTLYITHPNGLVTVYAHLDHFNPVIKSYALNFQYQNQTFEMDEYVPANLIKIKKGEIIGKSGNSGSSGGPHLHFEIRDSLENVLNPLSFGFSEIRDNLAPIIQKIAVRPLSIDSRVQQEYALKEWIAQKKSDGTYQIPGVIEASGSIGIELKVTDRMNETSNLYGVNCIELFVNGEEIFYHNIESFSFDESKYINVHIDYAHLVSSRQRLERCYVADGNRLSTYKKIKNRGRLTISPGETKQIEIRVYDAYGNKSILKCIIKGVEANKDHIYSSSTLSSGSTVDENVLRMACKAEPDEKATLYLKGKSLVLAPAYRIQLMNVYLYDLRKGLPDSVQCFNYKEAFNFVATIPPGRNVTVEHKTLTLSFADTTLFDTLYLQVKTDVIAQNHEIFEICSPATPVFGKISVRYCPQDKATETEKCYIYSVNDNSSHKFEGGEWNEDNILYDIKYLGKFAIRRDTIPPQIKTKKILPTRIEFSAFDSQSGIKSFRAELNGKWLLMNYDHKTARLWSETKIPGEKIQGTLTLEVIDKSLNTTTVTVTIP
ncbi:MAG: hypothetical protein JWO58_1044 [Chitinophagaceae bacterium]|nr:hypothetical protein [Chitinophagaceae bacterium]